jgi:hypothetical protein
MEVQHVPKLRDHRTYKLGLRVVLAFAEILSMRSDRRIAECSPFGKLADCSSIAQTGLHHALCGVWYICFPANVSLSMRAKVTKAITA